MSSTNDQQHAFPAAPPSLSAGDYEMRDYYAAQDAPRPTPDQAPYLTPYLGLRARLSQIWINRWTILLLLILVRTLLAATSINHGLASAKREALSACTSVESMGSAMASMPHYLSQGINELTASGIDKAVHALMTMLTLTITGVEEIVVFFINMLTQTYVCLITLAVSGSLGVALKVVEDVGDFLNKTLGEIGNDIEKVADGFQDGLNDVLKGVNGFTSLFGSSNKIPTLDLTGNIDGLKNLQIPSGFDEGLSKINSSIPTFSEVNNFTNTALRFPFEEVKGLIKKSMGSYATNRSLFPVPQKEQLHFCSDDNGISDFFDSLANIEDVAKKIFIGVITALAILVCLPMAYREIRRWRTMKQRAQLVSQNAFDPMDVIYMASRPFTSSAGITLANRFSSVRTQILIRWAVAYATSVPALFVLSLGVAGLAACLCQYILLRALQKEVPALAHQVGDFAEKVVVSLNNASQQWAIGTNKVINETNANINDDVFGWVNTTTGAVNHTLNVFVDGMTEVLNRTFGGTVLYDPILGVLNCLILLKIQGIQKGLTWVSDHAHIDFPRLDNNTFSLGAAASISDSTADDSFLANPNSEATDKITEAVVRLINQIADGIRQEAIISSCVLLIWFIIVLIGFTRSLFLMRSSDKTSQRGGQDFKADKRNDNMENHNDYGHDSNIADFLGWEKENSTAPPYEHATMNATRDRAGAYTLKPQPFPRFEPAFHGSTFLEPESRPIEEKGFYGARNVGNAVIVTPPPPNLRSSSYGTLGGTTPVDDKFPTLRNNPFSSSRDAR